MRNVIFTSTLILLALQIYVPAAGSTMFPKPSTHLLQDPVFMLPYENSFRIQNDYDQAVALGFEFNNVYFQEADGGSLEINGGSIITPPIDFSLLEAVRLRFRLSTRGLGDGQKLTISYSNDDGANYIFLEYIEPASFYKSHTPFIDLSSLTGTSGRIKIEMTEGTGSIQLREFTLREFVGHFYTHGNWTPSDPNGINTIRNIAVANGTVSFTSPTQANHISIYEDAIVNIESVLTITGDLLNLGNLTFVSNETVTGELGYISSISLINGNATVQRYTSDKRAYRMLSSAVSTSSSIHDNWQEGALSNTHNPSPGFGTHITGSTIDQQNGFDGTATGQPSMFTLNVEDQEFMAVSNTDEDTLNAGKAYIMLVQGNRSIDISDPQSSSETILRATGTLRRGNTTQIFETVDAGDFAMFGNPYQSTVDLLSVFGNSTNVNTNWYYVYDPNIAEHGAYVTIDLQNGTNTSMSRMNQYLPPGQGAQFASLGSGQSTIVFKETDKAPGFFRPSSDANRLASENMLTVQLFTTENFNRNGPVHDSFGIIFESGNDNEITADDALKPMNFDENFGIDHNGTYLSIERRDMPETDDLYQLYSSGYKHSDYTLKIMVDGLENSTFYLFDRFTRTTTPIENTETIITFQIDINNPMSIATDRFILGRDALLGVDTSFLSEITLYPNPFNGTSFYINAPKLNGKQISLSISDISGRRVFEDTFHCQANTLTVSMNDSLTAGIYLVTLKHGEASNTYKLIKK